MIIWHLAKRFIGSLTAAPLNPEEDLLIESVLSSEEKLLFRRLSKADARHAVTVLRRFDGAVPQAPLAARRAALLHDIGKVDADIGTFLRVAATIVGSHGQRFRAYHSHEERGIELLRGVGCDPSTLAYLRGEGDAHIVAALRNADEI